jgi:hypothetical protein
MQYDISVFKLTTDNWCGNYKITANYINFDAVEVYLKPMGNPECNDTNWIISVSGNDDMVLNKEYTDEKLARTEFNEILGWAFVNQKYLIEMGFKG